MSRKISDELIYDTILKLTAARGSDKTICPSEVARDLAPDDWRPLMPKIREAAAALQSDGAVAVTQSGEAVDPLTARGPIRIGMVVEKPSE